MDADGDGKPDILIPSVSKGFAARVCSVEAVAPFHYEPQSAWCPIADYTRARQSSTAPESAGCPVLACTDDPTTGTMHLPERKDSDGNPPPDGYGFKWAGLAAYSTYGRFDRYVMIVF
jgi:hypothetical protein